MKIERILYGMQTEDGKILTKYTSGVTNMLKPKSRDFIKSLKPSDSHKPLWFPTEGTIAYPVIIEVAVKDPDQGGRTWVQNQTFLVEIHDFLAPTLNGGALFDRFTLPELTKFPEFFEAVNI